MPGFDGTGPRGMGPMTGGGRGFCALPFPATWPVNIGRVPLIPYGVPWRAPYYGMGPAATATMPFAPQMTREQELELLKDQAQYMKQQLEQIEARLNELKSEED